MRMMFSAAAMFLGVMSAFPQTNSDSEKAKSILDSAVQVAKTNPDAIAVFQSNPDAFSANNGDLYLFAFRLSDGELLLGRNAGKGKKIQELVNQRPNKPDELWGLAVYNAGLESEREHGKLIVISYGAPRPHKEGLFKKTSGIIAVKGFGLGVGVYSEPIQ